MRRSLPALILLLLLAACHSGRGPERAIVVEAEGVSPVDADALRTRRRALAEAERAAVEKANGVAVSARTRLDLSVEVEQRILARAAGLVVRYKVLSESEKGGLHVTRIKAWVRKTTDAEAELVPLPPPGDPRVAVIVKDSGAQAQRSACGLRKGLSEAGVSVGIQLPDITVDFGVATRAQDSSELGGLLSWRAHVSARAIDVKTGALLAQVEREASAVDVVAAGASEKAAEKAGEAAGRELSAALNTALAGR